MASIQRERNRIYSSRVKGEVILYDVDIPDSAVARYEAFPHREVATRWIVAVQLFMKANRCDHAANTACIRSLN